MHGDHCLPNPQKRYASLRHVLIGTASRSERSQLLLTDSGRRWDTMSDETVTESELGIGVLAFYFGATNLITHLQSIEEVPSGVSFP
jgi:hypothetical protein